MLTICIDKLKPSSPWLHGSAIGEKHAKQARELIAKQAGPNDSAILDFGRVESATASYLKRLINPFFEPAGAPEGLPREMAPILVNVNSSDLKEEIENYLAENGRVLILADLRESQPRFRQLLGRLDRAAAETFKELRELNRCTAAALYERHREKTTNQTAWNNRLAQLVEMRLARRGRLGRFWIYEPTVES